MNLFDFLNELKKNNNREWFTENKSFFEEAKNEANLFFQSVYNELLKIDELEPLKMFRIYRDVRFSLDKTPYKKHFSAQTGRKKPYLRGGFYIHLEPGNCFIAGGFFGPDKEDLLRIRQSIEFSDELEIILKNKKLIDSFGALQGDELKTAPKGFPKEHERIELLRKKQFILRKQFSDQEIFQADFPEKVAKNYKILLPFFDYMTEVLTTNENGESLL